MTQVATKWLEDRGEILETKWPGRALLLQVNCKISCDPPLYSHHSHDCQISWGSLALAGVWAEMLVIGQKHVFSFHGCHSTWLCSLAEVNLLDMAWPYPKDQWKCLDWEKGITQGVIDILHLPRAGRENQKLPNSHFLTNTQYPSWIHYVLAWLGFGSKLKKRRLISLGVSRYKLLEDWKSKAWRVRPILGPPRPTLNRELGVL